MSKEETIDEFFSGKILRGDNFTISEIEEWYRSEQEGYANLGAKNIQDYTYGYHELNKFHGFNHLPKKTYGSALGIGSAYGDEFAPLVGRIEKIVVLDPSTAFIRDEIHGIPCQYQKPSIDGTIPFVENTFDLALSFGSLHHIPNVTYVINEIHRCLVPGGYALIREPIVSMGDWRLPRTGLTKNERGIPFPVFIDIIKSSGFQVVRESKCIFPIVPRVAKLFNIGAFCSSKLTFVDSWACRLFNWNLRYHARTSFQKLRPTCAFFVLRKI